MMSTTFISELSIILIFQGGSPHTVEKLERNFMVEKERTREEIKAFVDKYVSWQFDKWSKKNNVDINNGIFGSCKRHVKFANAREIGYL